MNIVPEEILKWTAALRSGSYRQGIGCLCKNDKYCCLGVACFIEFGQGTLKRWCITEWFNTMGCLPQQSRVHKLIGSIGKFAIPIIFKTIRYVSLIELNDSGLATFNDIAGIVEEQWRLENFAAQT